MIVSNNVFLKSIYKIEFWLAISIEILSSIMRRSQYPSESNGFSNQSNIKSSIYVKIKRRNDPTSEPQPEGDSELG